MTYGHLYRGFSITIEPRKGIYVGFGWNNNAYAFNDVMGGTPEKTFEAVKSVIDKHETSLREKGEPLFKRSN